MQKTVDVLRGQTIWDISVQETGTIENAMIILKANGLGPSDPMPSQLLIPEGLVMNNKILSFYTQKNIKPGTAG